MRNVRVWFTKLGRTKYISHLDINRCMNRAVRRAALPLWYTEGYNPHPYMTFSLPLPLGVESLCESMDIRIEDAQFTNEMVEERLNAVLPRGLQVLSVNDSIMKANEIVSAVYLMTLEFEEPVEAAMLRLTEAIENGQLLAEKKSKSGHKKIMKTIDLREFLLSYAFSTPAPPRVELQMTLAAGSFKNVNPVLMLDTILEKVSLNPVSRKFLRQRLLTESGADFK